MASPLLFEPILLPKVWGGDALREWGKRIKANDTIGESWELADLKATSGSGAGGGAQRSMIVNTALAGRTLHEAIEMQGRAIMGSARPTPEGGFPLLVKFLDARENLSVQVHPSPAYARAHPGAHLKTECWYILDAKPGAVIYKGIKAGVTREAFARHIAEGTAASDMIAVAAIAGDMHNLPSGTCHALGAGAVVAEIQTPSDTTFRVYDWGRQGRELHVAQALACIEFGEAPPATRLAKGQGKGTLVDNEFFRVDEWRLGKGERANVAELGTGGRGLAGPVAVIVVRGDVVLEASDGSFVEVPAVLGATALVPAACVGRTVLRGVNDATVLLAMIQ